MNLEGCIDNSLHILFLFLFEAVSWSLGWHQTHWVVKANASTSQVLRFRTYITLSGPGSYRFKVCAWHKRVPVATIIAPLSFPYHVYSAELMKYDFFWHMKVNNI